MKNAPGRHDKRRKRARSLPAAVKWAAAALVGGLIVYGVSQMSAVAYTEADIRVVDFSMLTSAKKRSALQAANQARCSCGCGMTLAQCVATDSTCPIREQNVQTIRTMVRQAGQP
jgi:uncharacterized membrane protein YjfL (UPF0719 family)